MTRGAKRLAESTPETVLCVGAVVRREDRVLFVRQAKGHPLEGHWVVPWGIVDPPEAPERTVLREIQEEGGIVAQVEGLLGIQDLLEDGWVALVFLCRHLSGEPRSDGGIETDGAAYLSLEEMDTFQEPIEIWCEWLVRRVLNGQHCLIAPEGDNPYRPKVAFL